MKLIKRISYISIFMALCPTLVFAANKEPLDIANFILPNAMKFIGIALILFGAVQIGFGFKDEDPNTKSKGLLVAVAGGALLIILNNIASFTVGGAVTTVEPPDGGSGEMETDIINPIASWIPQLGVIVMMWGCVQLALAMKNDNAGEKVKAMKIMVGGAALWQIVNIMNVILGG